MKIKMITACLVAMFALQGGVAFAESQVYRNSNGFSLVVDNRHPSRHDTRDDRRHSRFERRHDNRPVVRKNSNDEVVSGIIGFIGGMVAGSSFDKNTRAPVVRQHEYRYPKAVSYVKPKTPEWYRKCDARYRSFDARSGTFMGYDGQRHYCQIMR